MALKAVRLLHVVSQEWSQVSWPFWLTITGLSQKENRHNDHFGLPSKILAGRLQVCNHYEPFGMSSRTLVQGLQALWPFWLAIKTVCLRTACTYDPFGLISRTLPGQPQTLQPVWLAIMDIRPRARGIMWSDLDKSVWSQTCDISYCSEVLIFYFDLWEVHFAETPTWIGPVMSNCRILKTIENKRHQFPFLWLKWVNLTINAPDFWLILLDCDT